jgi:hypothetical protein
VQNHQDFDPFCVNDAETRRIRARMRASRSPKKPDINGPRVIPTLPSLKILGSWQTSIRQRFEYLAP